MTIQQYFLAMQGTLPEYEEPIGTALVLFSQNNQVQFVFLW